ncbi:MAG: hypothetical protein RG741_07085 [Bacteroidales bacterium]|nr:hypothetical protein [Bacteroidales bacterium]
MKTSAPALLALALMLVAIQSCKRQDIQTNRNLEQAHRPELSHIMAPGMGTVGLIREGSIHIYYMDETGQWFADESSRFDIPENNRGVLAMGMGTIAVKQDKALDFYRLNPFNVWEKEAYLSFQLPKKHDRLMAMKMPWEIGIIAVETEGRVDFYYFYDQSWQYDPTASFTLPSGIKEYYPAGDMTLAVIYDDKLGLYYLSPEAGWQFMDQESYVLKLPEGYEGVVPYERRTIAVLKENSLLFYALDTENDRWVMLRDLKFDLPG